MFVEDTGRYSQDGQAIIFQEFEQGGSTTRELSGTTGAEYLKRLR